MPSLLNTPSWRQIGRVIVPIAAVLSTSFSLPSYAQGSDAHASITPRMRIIERQNLRDVTDGRAPGAANVKVAVRHNSLSSDVVVKRKPAPVTVEPLISSARLNSEAVYVQELSSNTVLYEKGSTEVRPIASISKLMTALVVVESGLPMEEKIRISDADVDRLRYSRSRLPVGTELSRGDMLHLALMSSENRAANALGRYHPGGMPAFVRAMNDKARALGMRNTQFVEPTGLSADNVATARDLVKLVQATAEHPLIRRYSTNEKYDVTLSRGRQLAYSNTNRLVRNNAWDIVVSKTGFINEAGECLVMLTRMDGRDVAMVFLNASPRSRISDAIRIRSLVLKKYRSRDAVMCIAYVALNTHPDWPLLIAANRDEFHRRPSLAAAPWASHPDIIAGIDLQAGGTWLGVTRQGRFAVLTNYREMGQNIAQAPSRGDLVSHYLKSSEKPSAYADIINNKAAAYNGFNLIVGDLKTASYVSNRTPQPEPQTLGSGRYVVSNHLLDTPWPKAERLRQAFEALDMDSLGRSVKRVFATLKDTTPADDMYLPNTGISLEFERLLSSPFIISDDYGTRCSTIIAMHKSGRALLSEISYDNKGIETQRHDWPFTIT